MNAQARAFWKGSAITGTVVLLLSVFVTAATLALRPSAASSDVHTPTSTVTATVPGPTITLTAAATVPESCRAALAAADKVMMDHARNQATEGQALIDAGRTGDGSVLYAALAQMKARQPSDNADLSAYAAAKSACNGGG